jgi:hypothetical protein
VRIRKLLLITEHGISTCCSLQAAEQRIATLTAAAVTCSVDTAAGSDPNCLAAAMQKLRTAAAATATTASCSTEDSSSAYAVVKMLRTQRDAPVSAEEVQIAAKSFGTALSAVEAAALATADGLGLRSLYDLQVRQLDAMNR